MAKQVWKPGNMLYPVPAVMVTTGDGNGIDDERMDGNHQFRSTDGIDLCTKVKIFT